MPLAYDRYAAPTPAKVFQGGFAAVTPHAATTFVFAGRDHFTCGEPGWEAVADLALDGALAPVSGELVP